MPIDHINDNEVGGSVRTKLNAVIDIANEVALIPPGSGSPEGVVTASPGATYFDSDTNQFYFKKTGTGNTGWQLFG